MMDDLMLVSEHDFSQEEMDLAVGQTLMVREEPFEKFYEEILQERLASYVVCSDVYKAFKYYCRLHNVDAPSFQKLRKWLVNQREVPIEYRRRGPGEGVRPKVRVAFGLKFCVEERRDGWGTRSFAINDTFEETRQRRNAFLYAQKVARERESEEVKL